MKKKTIDLLTISFTALALILSVIGLFKDCHQDEQLKSITYWNNALQFRPLLKVLNPPQLTHFKLSGPKMAIRDLMGIGKTERDTIDINVETSVTFQTVFVNNGSSIAKIHSIVITDTTSGDANIRRKILSMDTAKINLDKDTLYFFPRELAIGDSMVIEKNETIQFVENKSFTIHVLVFYSNEMDIMYDTYYWARYETKDMITKPEFRMVGNILQYRFVTVNGSFTDHIKFKDGSQSTRVYSKEESDKIKSVFQILVTKSTQRDSIPLAR